MLQQINLKRENVTKKLKENFHQKKLHKDSQFPNIDQIHQKNYYLSKFYKLQRCMLNQVLVEL